MTCLRSLPIAFGQCQTVFPTVRGEHDKWCSISLTMNRAAMPPNAVFGVP